MASHMNAGVAHGQNSMCTASSTTVRIGNCARRACHVAASVALQTRPRNDFCMHRVHRASSLHNAGRTRPDAHALQCRRCRQMGEAAVGQFHDEMCPIDRCRQKRLAPSGARGRRISSPLKTPTHFLQNVGRSDLRLQAPRSGRARRGRQPAARPPPRPAARLRPSGPQRPRSGNPRRPRQRLRAPSCVRQSCGRPRGRGWRSQSRSGLKRSVCSRPRCVVSSSPLLASSTLFFSSPLGELYAEKERVQQTQVCVFLSNPLWAAAC